MSSILINRLSLFALGFVAAFLCLNVDTVDAQRPGLRPPGVEGGNDDGDANKRPNGRPAGVGNRSGTGNRGGGSSERKKRPRFINLLESKDLSSFRGYAQEEIGEGWSLDGKELYFDGSGGGDIITKEEYDDFDLQVEWKVADGANSGIMYRVSLGDSAPYMSGPEYQILDDGEHVDGKTPITSAGSLYGMQAPNEDKTLRDVGTWNKTRIIVEGNKITHYLNNKKVVEAEIGSDEWNKQLAESKFKDWEKFAKNAQGHIAFQDHGNEVWFRNIRIKRLESSQIEDAESDTKPRGGLIQGEPEIRGLDIGGGDSAAKSSKPSGPPPRVGERGDGDDKGKDKGK